MSRRLIQVPLSVQFGARSCDTRSLDDDDSVSTSAAQWLVQSIHSTHNSLLNRCRHLQRHANLGACPCHRSILPGRTDKKEECEVETYSIPGSASLGVAE